PFANDVTSSVTVSWLISASFAEGSERISSPRFPCIIIALTTPLLGCSLPRVGHPISIHISRRSYDLEISLLCFRPCSMCSLCSGASPHTSRQFGRLRRKRQTRKAQGGRINQKKSRRRQPPQ